MKKIITIFFLFLLVACTNITKEDSEKIIKDSLNSVINFNHNHNKKYFTYYADKSLNQVESGDLYSLFKDGDDAILLSINISAVISEKKEEQKFIADNFIIYQIKDKDLYDNEYNFSLYQFDDLYVSYFTINDFYAVSYSNSLYGITQLSRKMILLTRNARVHKKTLLENYAQDKIEDYTREKIDLFKIVLPSKGRLEDLIKEE